MDIKPATCPLQEIRYPLGVACHDAGGASQIFSFLEAKSIRPSYVFASGPAREIFTKSSSFRGSLVEDLDFINHINTLITGTGWATDLEHEARLVAHEKGSIYSITILDHWTNYLERFERCGCRCLPDEIWCVDDFSFKLASSIFDNTLLRLIPDYYALSVLDLLTSSPACSSPIILYLCEPIRSCWGHENTRYLGEFQAFEFFISMLDVLKFPKSAPVVLKPHPSESPSKYIRYASSLSDRHVSISTEPLVPLLSRSKWVVGCQTYALYLALLANKCVYSSIPPWGPLCSLPHQGIIHMRDYYLEPLP